jgi:hypothetical protein
MHEQTFGRVTINKTAYDAMVAALKQIDYEDDGPSGEIAANALKEAGIECRAWDDRSD